MRLFSRRRNAVKNWHNRALLIDFRKTRLTLLDRQEGGISDWIYQEYGSRIRNHKVSCWDRRVLLFLSQQPWRS